MLILYLFAFHSYTFHQQLPQSGFHLSHLFNISVLLRSPDCDRPPPTHTGQVQFRRWASWMLGSWKPIAGSWKESKHFPSSVHFLFQLGFVPVASVSSVSCFFLEGQSPHPRNCLPPQKKHGWWLLKRVFGGWWFQTFCHFQPYLGKWSNLTNIFQMGWFNHQLILAAGKVTQ